MFQLLGMIIIIIIIAIIGRGIKKNCIENMRKYNETCRINNRNQICILSTDIYVLMKQDCSFFLFCPCIYVQNDMQTEASNGTYDNL